MTLCPASGTTAFGNTRPIFGPYETAQCFDCLGRFRLVWWQGRFGAEQVLEDHEPERKP
jgi:hypothetical protein